MPESVNLMEENGFYISSRNKVGKYKVYFIKKQDLYILLNVYYNIGK